MYLKCSRSSKFLRPPALKDPGIVNYRHLRDVIGSHSRKSPKIRRRVRAAAAAIAAAAGTAPAATSRRRR